MNLLVEHHDALRMRYQKGQQTCLTKEETPFCFHKDLSHLEDFPRALEKEASLAQASLDLEKGPLLKVILFEGPKNQQRLLIAIHHLVIDGVSWRILLEDLEFLYKELSKNKKPSLPLKTHSYKAWALALKEYRTSPLLEEELTHWTQVESHIQPLPVDKKAKKRTSSKTLGITLNKEETSLLLQKVPHAYRTEINDILLSALVLAIGDWTQDYRLSLSLEGHGREEDIVDLDLSRTVGWFTSLFPLYLEVDPDLPSAIKSVKETLRHIPHKGIGYGILKYMGETSSFSSTTLHKL